MPGPASPLRGALSGPVGIPQPATYWNPNGAPRVMSAEIEGVLRQLELQAAAGQGGALSAMDKWQKLPPAPVGALAQAQVDPSWLRPDGTRKGQGFLGPLKFKDGRTSTELSIGVNLNGKETEIPSLVPTLTPAEIQHLLNGGEPHEGIVQKAVDHAKMRMQRGLPVFAE